MGVYFGVPLFGETTTKVFCAIEAGFYYDFRRVCIGFLSSMGECTYSVPNSNLEEQEFQKAHESNPSTGFAIQEFRAYPKP